MNTMIPRALAGAACLTALSGCSSGQLPQGSSLSISPDSRSIDIVERLDEDGRCRYSEDRFVDLPFVFALTDGQGSPVGDAELAVYVDFADNTYSGRAPLALYEDLNGDGVIDDETELVSGEDDEIAIVETDRYAGDASLMLRVNLSCAYRGGLFAIVDGVTASASIEIVAAESTGPESGETGEPATEGRS